MLTLSDRLGRPPTLAALGWTLVGLAGLVSGTLLRARLRMPAGSAALASVELAAAALGMAVVAPLSGTLALATSFEALVSFAYVAIVAGAAGPLLSFARIRQRGVMRASSLLFVVPALTALMAWPVLGSPVGPAAVSGLAIAAVGLGLSRSERRPDARALAGAVLPAR